MKHCIRHYLAISASPERIYEALTTPAGVRNWWTRDADLDGQAGGEGQFRFHAGKSVKRMRIDDLQPARRVVWTVMDCFLPPWIGTKIVFELTAEGERTVLRFGHDGFAEADDVYALTTTGWAYYLVSLQQYLQTGQGAPAPDVDFGRMIR